MKKLSHWWWAFLLYKLTLEQPKQRPVVVSTWWSNCYLSHVHCTSGLSHANSSWIFAKEGILWWQHAHHASLHMLALHPTSSSRTSMLCKDPHLCKLTSVEDKDTSCKFHNWAARLNPQRWQSPHCIALPEHSRFQDENLKGWGREWEGHWKLKNRV